MTTEDIPRAVLDTSVLLSSERHWLWLFAHEQGYEAVWSTFIVGELVRIRVEQAIAHGTARSVYRERINNLIHRLSDVLSLADYRSIELEGILSDPDDEPILAAALASRAGFIVSHNVNDFPSSGQALGIRFVTPKEFLTVLEMRHPDTDLSQHAEDAGKQLP